MRPNITVEIGDRKLFEEAVFQLGRPLNRSNIRVLALEPGGPKALASAPRFDPATKTALVDQIDPGSLPQALGKIKGQTVLVTGRVEGDVLHFLPAGGPEQKLFVHEHAARGGGGRRQSRHPQGGAAAPARRAQLAVAEG